MPLQELPYDYAFIGMGCANSLILLELDRAGLLAGKRIVVYEPEQKKSNDRTFCFWLEPKVLHDAGLDKIVSHSWSAVLVNEFSAQSLAGKIYFYLRADALYAHTSQLLSQYDVTLRRELLQDYPEALAHFVFDSRPPYFDLNHQIDVQISQSFYGWLVETEAPIFDPEVFTMMDFSIPQNGHTQFLYVLPKMFWSISRQQIVAMIKMKKLANNLIQVLLYKYITHIWPKRSIPLPVYWKVIDKS